MTVPAPDLLRHFWLLFCNCRMDFAKTWLEARTQCPLPSMCFSGWLEKQDDPSASDWLWHLRFLLWNRWTEFKETWQEARTQCPLPTLWVFFLAKWKTKMAEPAPDWLFIGDIFNYSSGTTQCPLPSLCLSAQLKDQDRSLTSDLLRHFWRLPWNHWKVLNKTWEEARTKHPLPRFFVVNSKTKMVARPLIGWDIFDFIS